MGLIVRTEARNLLKARQRWDRRVYDGPRSGGAIAFVETRDRLIGPIVTLTMKGSIWRIYRSYKSM